MKTNFFVVAALAASALLASCDKDHTGTNPEEEGKPTTMNISLNFPKAPQTRATADENATDAEANVQTVDVFIYYTSSGGFQSHTQLTAGQLIQRQSSNNADVYTTKEDVKIETTTGAKTVVAGINLPENLVKDLIDQPYSTLLTVAQTFDKRDELTKANNFVMFSKDAVHKVFKEDAKDNDVTLQCQRLVAKVTVETAASMTQGGVPGTLGALTFAVNNFNKKLFLLQGEAPLHKDPNWASAEQHDANDYIEAKDGDYVSVLSRKNVPSPSIDQYEASYAAENTSEGKLQKEISRVTVRSTFILDQITIFDGSDFVVINNPKKGTLETFYAVSPSSAEPTSYFTDESTAKSFVSKYGGNVLPYKDGVCYWTIFLNKIPEKPENKWDVLRNDFYKCNITRIIAPGRPGPEPPDPEEKPDDAEVNITADIEVMFWNTRPMTDYVLE